MSASSVVLPLAVDGDLGAQLRAQRAQLVLDVAVGRVQLGGELELDQRLFGLAGGGVPAAAVEVVLRGAQLGAIERQADGAVVGPGPGGLRVLDDGQVVVLLLLGDPGRRRLPPAEAQAAERSRPRAGRPVGPEARRTVAGSRVIA